MYAINEGVISALNARSVTPVGAGCDALRLLEEAYKIVDIAEAMVYTYLCYAATPN